MQKFVNEPKSVLILIVGDRGSGKTLLNARFCLKNQSPFYANYHVFSDNTKTKPHPLWHELHPEELLKLPIVAQKVSITEAYEFFESRLGMGAFQRFMSYIVFQSRKRKISFIIDTQLDDTIDHRFTRLCDYIIVAEAENYGFHYYCTNKHTISEFDITFKQAEKFWDLYDSWEVVTTPQIEDLAKQVEITNKPKLKQRLNELEKIFWETYDIDMEKKKITHALVDAFLLDLEPPESDVYSSFLYARLQKPTK